MASISKFNAAIATIPQELTVAAANFNLDFSLMKVEAPAEFQGLGQALSAQRRAEAEEGQAHVTARKLGALFEALVPPTPHLFAKYGERVSAISRKATAEMQQHPNAGIFARRAGPDGTSIWAAATSGDSALAIHLLACMLARIWKSHEAISLWVELVERRKQQIFEEFQATNTAPVAAVMAAKQSFSRQQLATWDASARAWIQTADADRQRQQTQLMLIINNVRIPVNAKRDSYESVVKAWISGMTAMECLAQGMPQRVQDGAVFVAMSAWHLYPDMEVLVNNTKHVDQHDELMAGALVTIGAHGTTSDNGGVIWSLPLSRMRYYSHPELTERRLASDTSRVTIKELWLVVLGIIISQWSDACPSVEVGCRLLMRLSKLVNNDTTSIAWIKYLAEAADEYLTPHNIDQGQSAKLVGLGLRQCKTFLGVTQNKVPAFFGLDQFSLLLSVVDDEEERVRLMRCVASTLGPFGENHLLIRYHKRGKDFFNRASFHVQRIPGREDAISYRSGAHFLGSRRLASVPPLPPEAHQSSYSTLEGEEKTPPEQPHCGSDVELYRWATINNTEDECRCFGERCGCVVPGGPFCVCKASITGCGLRCHNDIQSISNCTTKSFVLTEDFFSHSSSDPCDGYCSPACETLALESTGERCITIRKADLQDDQPSAFILRSAEGAGVTYNYLLGDIDDVALFSKSGVGLHQRALRSNPNIDDVEAVLASEKLNCENLATYLRHWWTREPWTGLGEQHQSINALVYATELYSPLKGATVSIEVLKSPFSQSAWASWTASLPENLPTPPKPREFVSWSEPQWSFAGFLDGPGANPSQLRQTTLEAEQSETEHPQPPKPKRQGRANSCSLPPRYYQSFLESKTFVSEWGLLGGTSTPKLGNDREGDEKYDRAFEVRAPPLHLSAARLSASFACIAMMETGYMNISVDLLRGVLAMSAGDSIFVAASLISDPADVHRQGTIQRVFGNLGRSEITFLLPPSIPRLKEYDLKSWHLINHQPFDGKFTDSFGSTSLHLSFTDFEMPVDVGSRGLRDTLAVLVESLVAIDDGGNHIGDLDILSMFDSNFMTIVTCEHQPSETVSEKEQIEGSRGLTSVDCWDEFFDLPHTTAIVRACGNWEARLAIAAASVQREKKVLLLPRKPCLECLSFHFKPGAYDIVIV